MKINIIHDRLPIIEVIGDIEHFLAPRLRYRADSLLEAGYDYLLFDLTQVSYIDSGGIEVMFSTLKKLPPNGRLCAVIHNPNIIRVFDLVGILNHKAFYLYSTREKVLKMVEEMSKSA